ncbi:nuclear GTPase SLIP-GC-like [Danio aesculapii]|uniref:nuclear GTPase SLIP-GC-like n=1 Tax=Danio aesculapii TaxID=1142201 RepID=UPI0024BF6B1F|nr:nuclear GTPase SLIP-GC-like [Danio aesculapii]
MDKGRRKKATIGVFGKSGEGKSSLLNSVLGKDLLPSGCYGACTAVTTQVEANLEDSDYKAEIELISKEEWEKELKDLFRDITADGEDKNEEIIETAEEKITALYGTDADKKTLEELKKDDKFAKIENFLSINPVTISNTDLCEFTNAVASYIQHSESSPGGWYWPLVKSVTIKIPDCHELLEHIVLVDLPGTGDCNKTRNDLWISKLRECSSVWIVSDINRAITDRDPWGILKHCIEELGPGGKCKNIKFICTKTDIINPAAYIRSARLQSVSPDKRNACILHRNEHAKAKVKEKFEKSEIKKIFSTDHHFQVFTVRSNAFFDCKFNLQPTETEILQLQDDLRSLNKSINRELAQDFVNKAKGTLLLIQSGQINTTKKTDELKGKVRIEYKKNLRKSLNELDRYFDSIYNVLEQGLSRGVEQSVQKCVASTKELIAPKMDGRGFHKILSALCKNHGCYWSKNWNKILDLNKELAKHLQECIDDDFRQIFPVSGKTGRSVQEQIDKFTIIQSDSAYLKHLILQPIKNYIQIQETKLKASLNIVDTKKDIYSSIQTTIMNEMSRCYEEAASITGVGSMKKKQELLLTTVDQKKEDMSNKAKTEVLKKLNNFKVTTMAYLKSRLKIEIKRSLNQTSKSTWKDVSREMKELEMLSELLTY